MELRYFGRLSIEQTAGVMELSVRTVNREWERARAWLRILMRDNERWTTIFLGKPTVVQRRSRHSSRVSARLSSTKSLPEIHGATRIVDELLYSRQPPTDLLASPAIHDSSEQLAAEPLAELTPGTRLGKFEIQRLLGEGGMARVYLATDVELDRRIALKVLLSRHDGQQLLRFEREARAVASLKHPNIAVIYERGQIDGHYYIASEFIEGETLREYLSTNGRMRTRLAVAVAIEIAEASKPRIKGNCA